MDISISNTHKTLTIPNPPPGEPKSTKRKKTRKARKASAKHKPKWTKLTHRETKAKKIQTRQAQITKKKPTVKRPENDTKASIQKFELSNKDFWNSIYTYHGKSIGEDTFFYYYLQSLSPKKLSKLKRHNRHFREHEYLTTKGLPKEIKKHIRENVLHSLKDYGTDFSSLREEIKQNWQDTRNRTISVFSPEPVTQMKIKEDLPPPKPHEGRLKIEPKSWPELKEELDQYVQFIRKQKRNKPLHVAVDIDYPEQELLHKWMFSRKYPIRVEFPKGSFDDLEKRNILDKSALKYKTKFNLKIKSIFENKVLKEKAFKILKEFIIKNETFLIKPKKSILLSKFNRAFQLASTGKLSDPIDFTFITPFHQWRNDLQISRRESRDFLTYLKPREELTCLSYDDTKALTQYCDLTWHDIGASGRMKTEVVIYSEEKLQVEAAPKQVLDLTEVAPNLLLSTIYNFIQKSALLTHDEKEATVLIKTAGTPYTHSEIQSLVVSLLIIPSQGYPPAQFQFYPTKQGIKLIMPNTGLLDLHYCRDVVEAKRTSKKFLKEAYQLEKKKVTVITGRGNHSKKGPVLKKAFPQWLKETENELGIKHRKPRHPPNNSGRYIVQFSPPKVERATA